MKRNGLASPSSRWLPALLATLATGCGVPPGTGETSDAEPSTSATGGVDFDMVYDRSTVQRYDLEIAPEVWQAMLGNPLSDEYSEATLRWGDEVYGPVGVRFKGNSSRRAVMEQGSSRFSFKIKLGEFVDGMTFHGVKTLNLHNGFKDPSFMREALSYDLFRDLGVPASRVAYVDLYLNGELQGMYISVEQVNKTFLDEWLGDNDGNLYKPETGELVYRGDSVEDYGAPESYELETNEAEADFSGLVRLIDILNNTPDADFPAAMEEVFEVETFLRWLAANTLLVSLDGYAGSIAHNYYLYDNPSTGRFTFIPWDYNESFGVFSAGLSKEELLRFHIASPYHTQSMSNGSRPLISRILAVEEYREEYYALVADLVANRFSVTAIDEEIDRLRALISDSVRDDPTKLFSWEEWESALGEGIPGYFGLASFIEARNDNVRAALDGTLEVICGDGICDTTESCDQDCVTGPHCPPCAVFLPDRGACAPSCAGGCGCPTGLPVPLICDPDLGICVPQAPQ